MNLIKFYSIPLVSMIFLGACGANPNLETLSAGDLNDQTLSGEDLYAILAPVKMAALAPSQGTIDALSKGGSLIGLFDFSPQAVHSFNEISQCPGGGTAAFSGNVSETLTKMNSTWTLNVGLSLDETLNACSSPSVSGKIFTINGYVRISESSGTVVVNTEPVSVNGNFYIPLSGNINISSAQQTITNCAINLRMYFSGSLAKDASSANASFKGNVCGNVVDASYSHH